MTILRAQPQGAQSHLRLLMASEVGTCQKPMWNQLLNPVSWFCFKDSGFTSRHIVCVCVCLCVCTCVLGTPNDVRALMGLMPPYTLKITIIASLSQSRMRKE